jgi:hypothetical protein
MRLEKRWSNRCEYFRRPGKPDDGADNVPKPVLVSDQAWKLGSVFYLDAQRRMGSIATTGTDCGSKM